MTVARLPLPHGEFALVDADLYDELSAHRWHRIGLVGLIGRTVRVGGKRTEWLHRRVSGASDHQRATFLNGDRLDNRRSNIIPSGVSQPQARVHPPCDIPGCRWIDLGRGRKALIDADMFDDLAKWTWQCNARRGPMYAYRSVHDRGRVSIVWMHRSVLAAPPGIPVDHVNGDGLDNRRDNLRLATISLNGVNSLHPVGASGFRGVRAPTRRTRWRAIITLNGVYTSVGSFGSAEEAARAYDRAVLQHFGEFAVLNFPEEHGELGIMRNRAAPTAIALRDRSQSVLQDRPSSQVAGHR